MFPDRLVKRLYHILVKPAGSEDTPLLNKSESEVPRNFILALASHFLVQLGDALANPKIILPWLMESVAAPLYLFGLLVPVRESGSMLPQIFIAGFIRRLSIRKWVWVVGSVFQSIAVAGIGLAAWRLQGALAGWSIIGLLMMFSLARGLSSVASKDVTGKTIPKAQRGQLNGWSNSAAGLLTLAFGGLLLWQIQPLAAFHYSLLLTAAAGLWLLAASTYAAIHECPGDTDDGEGMVRVIQKLSILRTDIPFRHFVLTRALLLCSALTAPYYVVLAQQHLGAPPYLLGLFIVASGAATLLASPFWGRLADRSSRRVLIAAAMMTAVLGGLVFSIDTWVPDWLGWFWLLPALYFLLTVAHMGVRIGRQTYVVDMAEGNRRTDYVAVGNTVIGFLLLVIGATGALTSVLTVSQLILGLSLMGVAGAVMALRLPEVSLVSSDKTEAN